MRPDSFSLNPYEVFGVSPDASDEEIRAAYRQHALRWHPDRNPNDEYSMRMMQRVNAAWAILKDEDSRAAYDRWERGGGNAASGSDAWEQPRSGGHSGREWYRPPPPPVISCPRCKSVNEWGSAYCYSCGYPFDEGRQQPEWSSNSSGNDAGAVSDIGRAGGFWVRLVAYLIDMIILFVAAIILGSFMGISIYDSDWIHMLLWVFYFTVWVAAWSTTLGKRIFGLRVVRNDGSKIGIGRAVARALCYYLSFIPLGIGFVMIAFRRDKRGLHDLICDTKVVYR